MKHLIYFTIIIMLAHLFFSCEDRLGEIPIDYNQKDIVVADSNYVIGFVNQIYIGLPSGYNRLSNQSKIASATDEAVARGNFSAAQDMALGIWSATNTKDDAWGFNYLYIRRANEFLNDIVPMIPERLFRSTITVDRLKGQVYFLRAMFYWELVKRYGGVPIITEVLGADEGQDVLRDSYDDCIQFIIDDCERAANLLPDIWPLPANNYGRATRGAAMALKSRALLYAASPLFNDPDIPQSSPERGAYDPLKWNKAAEAAHDVISMDVYSLFPNFANFFTTLANNNEMILPKMASPNNVVEQQNGPTGYTGGGGGTAPTLDLADAFRMADGSEFDWNNPDHTSNPFANREPRFDATFLYNGRLWMGSTVETFEGGKDMGAVNSSKTGFYMRKFLSETARWFGSPQGQALHCFPIIRYAEILLNYAEAMNEAYGPGNPGPHSLTPEQALNLVRARGGLNPVAPGLTKDQLREEIRLERRIELAFEEHRHLDVRRWKFSPEVLSQPVRGLRIRHIDGNSFEYTHFTAQNRVFRHYMYLYPIPQTEVSRNINLIQNTGW